MNKVIVEARCWLVCLLDLVHAVRQGRSLDELEAHLLQLREVRGDVAVSTTGADEDEGDVVEARHDCGCGCV